MSFGSPIRALVITGAIGVCAAFVSLRSYTELVRAHSPGTSLTTMQPGDIFYLLQDRSSGRCLGWYHQTLQEDEGYSLTNSLRLNTEFQGKLVPADVRSSLVFNTLNQFTGGFIRGATGGRSFGIQLEGIETISIKASFKYQEIEVTYPFSFHGPVEIHRSQRGRIGFHFSGPPQWRALAKSLEAQAPEMESLLPISPRRITVSSEENLDDECEREGIASFHIDDIIAQFSRIAMELYTLEGPMK